MTERKPKTWIVSAKFVRRRTKSKLTVKFDPPIEYNPLTELYPDWKLFSVFFEEDGYSHPLPDEQA